MVIYLKKYLVFVIRVDNSNKFKYIIFQKILVEMSGFNIIYNFIIINYAVAN